MINIDEKEKQIKFEDIEWGDLFQTISNQWFSVVRDNKADEFRILAFGLMEIYTRTFKTIDELLNSSFEGPNQIKRIIKADKAGFMEVK